MHTKNDKANSFSRLINRRIALIITFITLIIVSLTFIIFAMSSNNKQEYTLIDVYGRQRMLTQEMAKNANRKYSILQALNNGPLVETKDTLDEKINVINKSLSKAAEDFNRTLLSAGQSIPDKSLIHSTEQEWNGFRSSLDTIVTSKNVDTSVTQALIYINNNNEKLLNYCDQLTKALISNQKSNANNNMYISLFILISSIALLSVSLLQLYKYLVNPLKELYNGIENIKFLKKGSNEIPTGYELKPVIREIGDGFEKLNKLVELIENLNADVSFKDNLKYIYNTFSNYIPYSHIGIALLKDDESTLEASFGISDTVLNELPQKLFGLKVSINNTTLNKVIEEGKPRIINDLAEYVKNRPSYYNDILLDAGIKASIALPLKLNKKTVGIIFFSSIYSNIYNDNHAEFLEILSNSISISLNKNLFIDELLLSTTMALAKMAESRDEDTGDHLERMKKYSVKITELLIENHVYEDEITQDFIKDIERFSPMHDIGKVGIRDDILLKPGKLSSSEYEDMKKHTVYGAEVFRTAENNILKFNKTLFTMGIEIAEGHHEKWDGSGYPHNKLGEDIPLSARIVAVADVFDALTSIRPYKEAFPFEDSCKIIYGGKGRHFDPKIVDVFITHKDEIYNLYNKYN